MTAENRQPKLSNTNASPTDNIDKKKELDKENVVDIVEWHSLKSKAYNCFEGMEYRKTADCADILEQVMKLANGTKDIMAMRFALAILHTQIDAYSLIDIVDRFVERANSAQQVYSSIELFDMWDSAIAVDTNIDAIERYHDEFWRLPKDGIELWAGRVSQSTMLLLYDEAARQIVIPKANKLIRDLPKDDRGFSKYYMLLEEYSLEGALKHETTLVDYLKSRVTSISDPYTAAHLVSEVSNNLEIYEYLCDETLHNAQYMTLFKTASEDPQYPAEDQELFRDLANTNYNCNFE